MAHKTPGGQPAHSLSALAPLESTNLPAGQSLHDGLAIVACVTRYSTVRCRITVDKGWLEIIQGLLSGLEGALLGCRCKGTIKVLLRR